MRTTTLIASAFFAAALSGCVAVDDGPAAGSLANPGLKGTSWTLAGFQSMDDSKGTIRPEAGKTYTVNFNADGTVTAQLDCNRGNGLYQEGIANAAGGRVTIGPIASTRMACPPPSLGTNLAAWLQDVTSYTLRDGHLYLALKMDAGIIDLAPAR